MHRVPFHSTQQGGDAIDDVFGCTTNGSNSEVIVTDTYNIAGGGRDNVGDFSGMVYHCLGIFLLVHIKHFLTGRNYSTQNGSSQWKNRVYF